MGDRHRTANNQNLNAFTSENRQMSAFNYQNNSRTHIVPSSSTYRHQEPSSSTYRHQEPSSSTYRSQEPSSSTYRHQEPSSSTYRSQEPSSSTYRHQEPSSSTYRSQEPSSSTYRNQEPSVRFYNDQIEYNTFPTIDFWDPNVHSYQVPVDVPPIDLYDNDEFPVLSSNSRHKKKKKSTVAPRVYVPTAIQPPRKAERLTDAVCQSQPLEGASGGKLEIIPEAASEGASGGTSGGTSEGESRDLHQFNTKVIQPLTFLEDRSPFNCEHFPGYKKIPNMANVLQDSYGLLAILESVKNYDPTNLSAVGLGIDIDTLGINLNYPGELYHTFDGPYE